MTTRIEPTIGRVVWFWPDAAALTERAKGTPVPKESVPHAAQIAFVNPDGTINIGWLTHDGTHTSLTDVELCQEGDDRPAAGPFCAWMPYQVGQAKTHEQPATKNKR